MPKLRVWVWAVNTSEAASSMLGNAAAVSAVGAWAVWRWLAQRAPPATRAPTAKVERIQRVDFFMVRRV
jgi:hypothetical protein